MPPDYYLLCTAIISNFLVIVLVDENEVTFFAQIARLFTFPTIPVFDFTVKLKYRTNVNAEYQLTGQLDFNKFSS